MVLMTITELLSFFYIMTASCLLQKYENDYVWAFIGLICSGVDDLTSIFYDIFGLCASVRMHWSDGSKKDKKHIERISNRAKVPLPTELLRTVSSNEIHLHERLLVGKYIPMYNPS